MNRCQDGTAEILPCSLRRFCARLFFPPPCEGGARGGGQGATSHGEIKGVGRAVMERPAMVRSKSQRNGAGASHQLMFNAIGAKHTHSLVTSPQAPYLNAH